MSIDISPEHRDFVQGELERGHFTSEQELVDEAIELLKARQDVLNKLDHGLDQLDRGEGIEYGPDDRQRFVADILARSSIAREQGP
jgi:Arc/MetJ-type ribon-helix-helix transcriptional regulator